jgi:dihydrofolate reductase
MKTIVYMGTSLDGFIARDDGEIGWLEQFASDEAFVSYNELMERIAAVIIGRGTFEKVLTFAAWPYQKHAFLLSTTIIVQANGLVRSYYERKIN